MTKAVYIKNQPEWIGVDQTTDNVDFELYDDLKNFLHLYYCSYQEFDDEEEKWCSSIENGLTRNNFSSS